MSDAVQFGASIRRVARPVPGADYFYIPAGTATAHPRSVLASDRWKRLGRGFVDAGVTLVVFTPADEAGAEEVLAQATDVVVLRERDANQELDSLAPEGTLRAVLGPGEEDEPSAAEEDPEAHVFTPILEAEDGEPGARDEAPAPHFAGADAGPLAHGDPAESASIPPAEGGLPGEDEAAAAHDTPPADGTSAAQLPEAEAAILEEATSEDVAGGRGSRGVVLLVLSLVLLAIVGAAAMGWVHIPGLSPESPREAVPQDLTPAAHTVPVSPQTPTQAYSVGVAAYTDLDAARARARGVDAVEGAFGVVAPVNLDGTVFYRVLAGPATDSLEAAALAERLAAAGTLGAGDWVVRHTPLAFHLGEMGDPETARQRVEALEAMGIPAYVLAVDYQDRQVRYRVYAGAYAHEAEAEYLLGRMEAQGLNNATLVTRVGRLP